MDWAEGMEQRFRYYLVDKATWADADEVVGVRSCTVTRDLEADTRESAKLTVDRWPYPGEPVVRAYIECRQGGAWERVCVGTWLCQTPSERESTGSSETEVRAYSTLKACADDDPPEFANYAGYTCEQVCNRALGHGIAPVTEDGGSTPSDPDWVLDPGSSWLDLASGMASMARKRVMVDPYGRPYLQPEREAVASTWEFRDGEGSVRLPGMTDERDWYDLPNTARVVFSTDSTTLVGEASTPDSRGRTVLVRDDSPDLPSNATQADVDRCAERLLAEPKPRTIEFEHAFCPVELGECVTLEKDGKALRAVVVKQEIGLSTGCTVKETVEAS